MNKSIIEKLGITSGPWYDFISPEQHRCWIGTKSNEPYYVAEIIGIERSMGKLEANTKLIATAPEMLEALISVCVLFETFKHKKDMETLLPVIEKATGKSWEEIKELLE